MIDEKVYLGTGVFVLSELVGEMEQVKCKNIISSLIWKAMGYTS